MPQVSAIKKEDIKMEDTNGGSSNDKDGHSDPLSSPVVVPPRPPQRAVARAVSNLGNTW